MCRPWRGRLVRWGDESGFALTFPHNPFAPRHTKAFRVGSIVDVVRDDAARFFAAQQLVGVETCLANSGACTDPTRILASSARRHKQCAQLTITQMELKVATNVVAQLNLERGHLASAVCVRWRFRLEKRWAAGCRGAGCVSPLDFCCAVAVLVSPSLGSLTGHAAAEVVSHGCGVSLNGRPTATRCVGLDRGRTASIHPLVPAVWV